MFKRSKERKINRLPGYDYSSPGHYFITICTQNLIPFFGTITNGKMKLNGMGKVVEQCWFKLLTHFKHLSLNEFIVMPNHVHGILTIETTICNQYNVGDTLLYPLHKNTRTQMLIPKAIHGFKSCVTRNIRNQFLPSSFAWQRSYYDHIIRNEKSLGAIQRYIKSNPKNWQKEKAIQKL